MSPPDHEHVETPRLVLRRPRLTDAEEVFARYASDPEVTRFLGWAQHADVEATRAFLAFSDVAWEQDGVGVYLIEAREDGTLLGSTGLHVEAPGRASTGYALARDAWGRGIATESLRAVVDVARRIGLHELVSHCHVDHEVSQRVLLKCGFQRREITVGACLFPNLDDPRAAAYRFDLAL